MSPPALSPTGAAALRYARHGLGVFPCWWPVFGGDGRLLRCACPQADACTNPGKHPISECAPQGFQSRTTDSATVVAWWSRFPHANVGGCPGDVGCVACDLDKPTHHDAAARWGLDTLTLQCVTGNGVHAWFATEAPTDGVLEGIIVRAVAGYVLLPPSRHRSGVTYAWRHQHRRAALPAAAAAALAARRAPGSGRARLGAIAAAGHIPEGERHETLLTIAGALLRAGLSAPWTAELVQHVNATKCTTPKDADEVARLVAWAADRETARRAGQGAPEAPSSATLAPDATPARRTFAGRRPRFRQHRGGR